MADFSTWNKDVPSGASLGRDIDNTMRSDKSILEAALNDEHYFESASSLSAGEHRRGSARVYVGTASQVSTVGDDGRLMFATDENALYVLSSTSTVKIQSVPDKVYAIYTTAAGGSFPDNSVTTVNYGTLEDASNASVVTGANWRFIAEKSGVVEGHASVMFAGSAEWADAEAAELRLVKNGALLEVIDRVDYGFAGIHYKRLGGPIFTSVVTNDAISIQVYQKSAVTQTLELDARYNRVALKLS